MSLSLSFEFNLEFYVGFDVCLGCEFFWNRFLVLDCLLCLFFIVIVFFYMSWFGIGCWVLKLEVFVWSIEFSVYKRLMVYFIDICFR